MKTIIENPLYFDCKIVWKDDDTSDRVIIKLGDYIDDEEDTQIFYYVKSLQEINSLLDENNNDEFYIDKIYSIDNNICCF